MKAELLRVFAAGVGAVLSFFTGLPPLLLALLATMTLDYATGLLCALMGRSMKTENGGLSSGAAFFGLMKKALILGVVALSALLDFAVQSGAGVSFSAVTGASCLWFIAAEGLSIVENAAGMGVPIPEALRGALEAMKGRQTD